MRDKRKYADRAEYLKKAVSKRRKYLRKVSIEYKGGSCNLCGYSKCPDALEFHHLNSNMKDFGLSKAGLTRSWEKTKKELDKCILVCADCHRELHSDLRSLPEKSGSENEVNCWKPKIYQQDQGNQQPSLVKEKGSETIF